MFGVGRGTAATTLQEIAPSNVVLQQQSRLVPHVRSEPVKHVYRAFTDVALQLTVPFTRH